MYYFCLQIWARTEWALFFEQGLVSIKDKPQQMIVQGIHELYDLEESLVGWRDDAERACQLVFIGEYQPSKGTAELGRKGLCCVLLNQY